MRNIFWVCVFLLVTMTACTSYDAKKKVVFYNTYGEEYNTATFRKKINKEYDASSNPFAVKIIVLATNGRESSTFISQIKAFDSLDAEKYGYLYIIANAKSIDKSGYYTDKEQAEAILNGDSFKVIIYDENGKLIASSTHVIDYRGLKQYLTKPVSPQKSG